MINRNDSVRSPAKNFKLPPIQGAIPTADILRKPTAPQNQAPIRHPKQNEQRIPRDSRQAFVVPDLKPIGQQRRYRHSTSRAAGYAPVKTANIPRKPMIERDFINPRLVLPQAGHAPDFLQSYAVLPPIRSETNAPAKYHTQKPRSKSSSVAPKASGKKGSKEAKTKQKSAREANETMSMGERKTSATLLLFYQGTRKDRRVGVCPENEPTLINITEQLREIFLRRNMEEMYLI